MLIAGWLLLRLQGARRVRVLERQILGVLRQHVELGRRCLLRGAVAVGHENLSWGERGPGPVSGHNSPARCENALIGASG